MWARARDAGRAEPPRGLHADTAYTDVYVNDSLEATDAIAKAELLTEQGRWRDAAELLQETAEQADTKLLRVAPGYYVGLRKYINDLMAQWPAEGIAAYRALFEGRIQEALKAIPATHSALGLIGASNGTGGLIRAVPARKRIAATAKPLPDGRGSVRLNALYLFDRYFCTSSAAKLADTIAQLAIEAGDFELAEHVYRRVLENHPDREDYAPQYGAMLKVVAALRGTYPGDDPAKFGGETKIRWMGQDRSLKEVISSIDAEFAALHVPVSPLVWPIFRGDARRNRISSTEVDAPGLLWRFEVFKDAAVESADDRMDIATADKGEGSRYLSIQPVVSGGFIFVQHGREIVALHRNTGAVAWRFRADAVGSGTANYLDEQPPAWDSPTVYRGRLYASLPGDTVSYYSYESARSPPELVCLEANSGQVIWRVEQEVIEEAFADISFDSSPIVRHDRMYIVGRRRRSFGFEDCFLYRINAANGVVEQRTHLGSASTGTFGSRRASRSTAAMHDDTVYVCTNLGSITAVSAYNGAVRWLRLYEREQSGAAGGVRLARDVKPWQFNPVIWSAGRIIALPLDAGVVLVLSADDGRLERSIPLSRLADAETLLGVQGDLLFTAGREVACYDLAADSLRWSTPLPGRESLYGRGVLLQDRLLIPTRTHLCSFTVADGSRSDASWGPDGEGGNLLALPDQIIVAGDRRILAYVRKAKIWMTLRQRMAESPSDPLPALELAEIALSNGEFTEAVEALDEAVRRAERLGEPPPPALARRLFDDVLTFAGRLKAHASLDADTLNRLFTYAARYPPDPKDHLRYRFRFAELFEEQQQPARAVRLYQQILRDRLLRELDVGHMPGKLDVDHMPGKTDVDHMPGKTDTSREREASGLSAGKRAEAKIAELIAEHGPSIYAEHEAEARGLLESGRKDGDIRTLQRLVETFPNSKAAPPALIAQGDLLAALGKPLQAVRYFSAAYHRYPKQVDRPGLLRKIADAYELAGKTGHAYLWLTKAAREHPAVRIEHQGRPVTFLEYRERLAHVRRTVEPSRPHVSLPLQHRFKHKFEGTVTLLAPQFGDQPISDWSRYFVQTEKGIEAYDARTGTELWSIPSPVRSDARLLVATADVAVFATAYEVFALGTSRGDRRWSHGEYPEHVDRAEGDWEDGKTLRGFDLYGLHLVSVRDDGQMSCLSIDTGEIVWSRVHRPKPEGRFRLAGRWLVYHVTQDDSVVVCLVDAATGTWSDAIHTGERIAVEDLFVTLDGQLVVATSRSIISYDPDTRERRWRLPLDGRLRRSSLILDVDALYFSDDGTRLKKLGLEDGRVLWESQRLTQRGDEDLTAKMHGGSVFVGTGSSVSAVDAVTGLTLWQGTTPKRPHFVTRLLTEYYIIALDLPAGDPDAESTAYFYDHRNGSGIIAPDGGVLKLGRLSDLRAVMAVDGALLIQTGSTIHAWRRE